MDTLPSRVRVAVGAEQHRAPRGRAWLLAMLVGLVLGACSSPAHQLDAPPRTATGPAVGAAPPSKPPGASAPEEEEDGDTADEDAGRGEPTPSGASCGNGKLDDGETCDPSSRNGACPTDCDDDDPCTDDRLQGAAERCNARCAVRPVTGVLEDGTCCQLGVAVRASMCDAPDACTDCSRDAGAGAAPPTGLAHRYSFDGTGSALVDSVGDADGRVVGTSLSGSGTLALDGTSGRYASLPRGLISALTSATIEVWVTLRSIQPTARLFDFGSRSGGPIAQGTTFWALSPSSFLNGNPITVLNFTPGVDGSADEYALSEMSLGLNRQQHLAAVFDADAGTLRLYINGSEAGSARGVNGSLADIDDAQLWIGRALDDTYPALAATVHELRIWSEALDAAAIRASNAAGPDELP